MAGANDDVPAHDSSLDLLARAEVMLKRTESHQRPEATTTLL